MLQNYIDKINNHDWNDLKLKAATTLAIYVNYGLIEFARSMEADLAIDIENIINKLIEIDSKNKLQ